jgi:hypothetical protein
MHICTSHEFDASLERVLDSLIRAEYAAYLCEHHPFFEDVRVLSLSQDAYSIRRYVRYQARPIFAKLGPFSIPASWFVWTEVSVLDLRTHVLTFENIPELESIRPKVVNRGKMVFRALPGRRSVRHSTFDIELRVPLVYRPFVELGTQLVGVRVQKSLDQEAEVLSRWVAALWSDNARPLVQPDALLSARVLN